MRAGVFVGLAAVVALGGFVACSAFDSASDGEPTPAADAAGADVATPPPDGAVPPDGGTVDPGVEVVADDVARPTAIAVTSSYVYWTAPDEKAIDRCTLTGPIVVERFLTTNNGPDTLAVVDSTIYFGDRAAKSIGKASEAATGNYQALVSSAVVPFQIAATNDRVWTAESNNIGAYDTTNGALIGVAGVNNALDLHVSGGTLWYTQSGSNAGIGSTPVDQLSFSITIANQVDARAVVADPDGTVYWSVGGAGEIRKRKPGSGVTTFVPQAGEVLSLAKDELHLYWITRATLSRKALSGSGTVEDLGPGGEVDANLFAHKGIALTPTHVYWIDGKGKRILRRKK